jgi:hypothetical protein
MSRPVCSPRLQNDIDFARHAIEVGSVEPELARRFHATLHVEPQRGVLDCGMGLCGSRFGRLGATLARVTCPDCLELLERKSSRRDATFDGASP